MPKRLQIAIDETVWTAEVAGNTVSLTPDGVVAVTEDGGRIRAQVGNRVVQGAVAVTGHTAWVTVEGEVFVVDLRQGAGRDRSGARQHDALTPPMPATVVRIAVKPGDSVRDGDVLISLEAMKMELPIRAPRDGVVRAVHCHEGDLVQPGDALLEFD